MYDNKNLAEDILKLESVSGHGDPESLAAIYFAMYKQDLISTRELEVMIGSYKNRDHHHVVHPLLKPNNTNTTAAVILALGDVLAEQVKEGKTPDEASINYLKWNTYEVENRSEVIQGLFKIMKNQISAGKEPDWELIESLTGYSNDFLYPRTDNKRVQEADPKSFLAIKKGVAPICHACQQNSIALPKSLENFLSEKNIIKQDNIQSLPINSDDFNSDSERRNAFRELSRAYIKKIEDGNLSLEDWQEAVFRIEVAPLAHVYRVKKEKLQEWYRGTQPKIAAANAALAGILRDTKQKMTSSFKSFLHSSDGLQNLFLCKAFHDNWLRDYDGVSKAILALPKDALHCDDRSVTVLTSTNNPQTTDEWAMVAREVSKIPNVNGARANGLTRLNPVIHIDHIGNMNRAAIIDGYIKKGEQVYHVFDPNGKIPMDYLLYGKTSLEKVWRPSLKGIPHAVESDLEMKGLSDAILDRYGVEVPKNISFWTEKDLLNSAVQEIHNAFHPVDDKSLNDIATVVRQFVTPQDGTQAIQELVIKPVKGGGGRDVTMWRDNGDSNFPERVAKKVLAFAKLGVSVILQERIKSPRWVNAKGESTDCCFRVAVCPNEDGEAVACASFARVGETGKAVNTSQGAKPMFTEEWIEGLRRQHPDLSTEINTLEERILKIAKDAYEALKKHALQNDPPEPGKDMFSHMGIDVMINLQNGKLTPTVIEVNGPFSGAFAYRLFDFLNPSLFQKVSGLFNPLYRNKVDPSLFKKYGGGHLPLRMRVEEIARQVLRYHRELAAEAASQTTPVVKKNMRERARAKAITKRKQAVQAAKQLIARAKALVKGQARLQQSTFVPTAPAAPSISPPVSPPAPAPDQQLVDRLHAHKDRNGDQLPYNFIVRTLQLDSEAGLEQGQIARWVIDEYGSELAGKPLYKELFSQFSKDPKWFSDREKGPEAQALVSAWGNLNVIIQSTQQQATPLEVGRVEIPDPALILKTIQLEEILLTKAAPPTEALKKFLEEAPVLRNFFGVSSSHEDWDSVGKAYDEARLTKYTSDDDANRKQVHAFIQHAKDKDIAVTATPQELAMHVHNWANEHALATEKHGLNQMLKTQYPDYRFQVNKVVGAVEKILTEDQKKELKDFKAEFEAACRNANLNAKYLLPHVTAFYETMANELKSDKPLDVLKSMSQKLETLKAMEKAHFENPGHENLPEAARDQQRTAIQRISDIVVSNKIDMNNPISLRDQLAPDQAPDKTRNVSQPSSKAQRRRG